VERGTCPARGLIVVAGHRGRLLKKAAPSLMHVDVLRNRLDESGGWRPLLGAAALAGPMERTSYGQAASLQAAPLHGAISVGLKHRASHPSMNR